MNVFRKENRRRILFTLTLLTEPVLLSLAGLLIGICAVYYGFPEIPAARIGMFAGAYLGGSILGAILGVVHITRKMPLELLQVKE